MLEAVQPSLQVGCRCSVFVLLGRDPASVEQCHGKAPALSKSCPDLYALRQCLVCLLEVTGSKPGGTLCCERQAQAPRVRLGAAGSGAFSAGVHPLSMLALLFPGARSN